jgi:hypothetical protein
LILTGGFGICPFYALLVINTKSVGEKLGTKQEYRACEQSARKACKHASRRTGACGRPNALFHPEVDISTVT